MAGEIPAGNARMHFTKTETEYNMKSIRFLLLTITTMFIVIAGLMIVLGYSVYSHYHSFSYFYESARAGRFITPSALCIFLGLAFMVVSIFGFFGSLKQSTCMVNVYALILILVFIFELIVVVLAFTVDTDTLLRYVDIPVKYYNDPEIQAEIDYIQTTLGCCGSNSSVDYMDMTYQNQSVSVVSKVIDGNLVSWTVPSTCCVTTEDSFCSRIWSIGCKEALVNAIMQNSTIIGVLGVSVMFINLLGIVFALLLARCIRKMKSERALISWRIREKIIMAHQVEEQHKNENQVYIDHHQNSSNA